MQVRSAKERLYWLLKLLKGSEIELDNFCNEFHITFDHELNFEELNVMEKVLFKELAELSARFSDDPQDYTNYPNVYTTRNEVETKVRSIFEAFNI